MGRRKHPRIILNHLSVDVNDGVNFFQGNVSDISRSGIGLADLPRELNTEAGKMTIVVSRRDNHFRLDITPRWHVYKGNTKSIGSKILNSSWAWEEFVSKFEQRIQKELSFI